MKPYYQDEAVTIYHGDCREWMPEADAVVTDPPYGANKAEWDDRLPMDALRTAAGQSKCMAIMPGIANIGVMPDALGSQRYRWTMSAYLSNGMTRGALGFGNWIACLLYSVEGVSLYSQSGDARAFIVGTQDKPDHPSPKPLSVMSWIISRVPEGVILDPFMGSGTTLLAAKEHGRRAIGIEIDERYCEMAAKRMAQETLGLVG